MYIEFALDMLLGLSVLLELLFLDLFVHVYRICFSEVSDFVYPSLLLNNIV